MKFNNINNKFNNNNKRFDHDRIISNVYKIYLNDKKHNKVDRRLNMNFALNNYIVGINKIKKDLRLIIVVERNSNAQKMHTIKFVREVKTYTVYGRWQMKIHFAMSRHQTVLVSIKNLRLIRKIVQQKKSVYDYIRCTKKF